MSDTWARAMQAHLRLAKAEAPDARVLRPTVESVVQRAARSAAARGASAQVAVQVQGDAVFVTSSGPGAGALLRTVRADLDEHRPQMVQSVREQALRALGGH